MDARRKTDLFAAGYRLPIFNIVTAKISLANFLALLGDLHSASSQPPVNKSLQELIQI